MVNDTERKGNENICFSHSECTSILIGHVRKHLHLLPIVIAKVTQTVYNVVINAYLLFKIKTSFNIFVGNIFVGFFYRGIVKFSNLYVSDRKNTSRSVVCSSFDRN